MVGQTLRRPLTAYNTSRTPRPNRHGDARV